MSAIGHLTHFDNFARLHRATHADLPALSAFSSGWPAEMSSSLDWRQMVSDRDAYVLVATECQIIVGVCVVHHEPSAALAHLSWIGVQSAARCRGLGSMLLGTAIDHAQSEGAANMVAKGIDELIDLRSLLLDNGFVASAAGSRLYSRSLWNERHAPSYCDFSVPLHQPTKGCDTSVCGLMLAMGTLDETMLLTAQAEKVLQHEIDTDRSEHGEVMALVRAAVRRRFSVVVHGHDGRVQPSYIDYTSAERIRFDDEPLTPERVVGQLSRRHLPLLHLHFPRLDQGTSAHWYLVTGFDGYLFRLVDVARQTTDETVSAAVTAPEIRVALAGPQSPIGITIARVI